MSNHALARAMLQRPPAASALPVGMSNHALARAMLQRCHFTFDNAPTPIPREFLKARWETKGEHGFYHFVNRGQCSAGLFRDIAKKLNLNSLHLHLVAGKLVVTFTRRDGGVGEQTAHFDYRRAGRSLYCE
jgi:hypothetical protein